MQRIAIPLGVLVFLILILGGYFMYKSAPALTGQKGIALPSGQSSDPNIPGAPPGTRKYTNQTYRFSLFYPQELIQTEYREDDGRVTVTFEAEDGSGRGFQVFVTPYSSDQITAERLKMDIPSGVVKEQVEIIVGGKPATMFYSSHALLGETREVWFINNGYLYEVTTYKELDEWLSKIMSTWQFI